MYLINEYDDDMTMTLFCLSVCVAAYHTRALCIIIA